MASIRKIEGKHGTAYKITVTLGVMPSTGKSDIIRHGSRTSP